MFYMYSRLPDDVLYSSKTMCNFKKWWQQLVFLLVLNPRNLPETLYF